MSQTYYNCIVNRVNNLPIRHEEFEGQRHIVAPVVILTEGVHAGNRGPMYYPLQWFSLSNPTDAGDLSTGYTCAIATPDSSTMSLFYNGKVVDKMFLHAEMTGRKEHHTWFHITQSRLANGLSYDLRFIGEANDMKVYNVHDKRRQNLKPMPLVICDQSLPS